MFPPGYKVHLQLLPLGFSGSFIMFSTAKRETFEFWSQIFKRLLGETHVFGRTFSFCIFLCNDGALNLLRRVVDLSVSLKMSEAAETT